MDFDTIETQFEEVKNHLLYALYESIKLYGEDSQATCMGLKVLKMLCVGEKNWYEKKEKNKIDEEFYKSTEQILQNVLKNFN